MRTLVASALVALTLAGSAQAQTAPAPRANLAYAPPAHAAASEAVASGNAEWAPRVSPQLVTALRSPSSEARARALHAVGNLAYAPSAGADLRPAIPALLHVFRTDSDERLRVMALGSLEATGDEEVMAALRAEVPRQGHPYVQRALLAALADHYGVEALRHDDDVVAMARSLRDGR